MIRPAEYRDIPVMMEMCASFMTDVPELEALGMTPDPDTIEFLLQDHIDLDSCCILVAEVDGQIIGGIIGLVAPWQWNGNIITLIERGWFIPKENRGKYPMAALGLRRQFYKWGKEQGATVLVMVSTVREESPRVIEHYKKDGMIHMDNNFLRRL